MLQRLLRRLTGCDPETHGRVLRENQQLRKELEEARTTLDAIRNGEVDALVMGGPQGDAVYTLSGADHPYRVLIEAMQQGAVTVNAGGTVLHCNRRFAGMLQRAHEAVIGAALPDFVPPTDRPGLEAMLRRAVAGEDRREMRLQSADGTLLPVLFTINPLPLRETPLLGLIVTDLTQQKQHEDLKDADRRKDEFLAMLAHELRNPLAPIRNALHLLKLPEVTGAVAAQAREMMERQVEHMVRLVDDLLDVSRITRGKIKLQKEPVRLTTILSRAVEAVTPLMEARRHQFTASLPAEDVLVEADPTRMAQVVVNLLNNAAKFTPEGGRISLGAGRQGRHAVITVRDNGLGIRADALSHIFDLFVQADSTLDRSQGGLGIGLTLVRSLLEMHGGSVEAFSDGPGRGSEFVVQVPVSEAPRQEPPGNGVAEGTPHHASRRILVVDDNVDAAESLALILKLQGDEVRTAHDGPAALEVARAFQPEVILLDIGLPGMSGYEVARTLREEPPFEEALVVAMTGYGQDEDRRRSQESGFDHHLVKPVQPDALYKLLADANVLAAG